MTNNADAQIARGWAERALNLGLSDDVPIEGYLSAARHILATTTPPTMADIAWDDEVHVGLCAEHAKLGTVRMLSEWRGEIACFTDGCATLWLPPKRLTPIPGTRLDLTPRRESVPESTPEPEQPTVLTTEEDVKPDPQPGEAWLIEYEGKRYEAIYWYSYLYAHWVFVKDREGTVCIESHEAKPVSRLVREAAPSHPGALTTREDYENAPEGTIVAGDHAVPWFKHYLGFWLACGADEGETSTEMSITARRVLRWGKSL